MKVISKEYLITENSRLIRENTLYLQYVNDLANGIAPAAQAIEKNADNDLITGYLYRPEGAAGGIVIMEYQPKSRGPKEARIFSLDELWNRLRENFSEHALPEKLVVERLVRERNKICRSAA